MKSPLVSAIVPVYNGASFLAASIESILKQEYRPIEVIVVDDGSADQTARVAKAYSNVFYIYQPNQGPSVARNQGIKASKGEFLAFLDADDLWFPRKITLQVQYLMDHPGIGYVLAHRRLVIEEGHKRPAWYRKELFEKDSVCFFPSALMARSEVFEKAGLFNPEYRVGEGAEWFARAKDAGIEHAILNETLVLAKVHDENLTHQMKQIRSSVLGALKASVDRQREKKE